MTSGQPIAWYVYDGLGSVACELNPNGTVAARKKLDVYDWSEGAIDFLSQYRVVSDLSEKKYVCHHHNMNSYS